MKRTFIELSRFAAVRDNYFVNDENFRAFQNGLLADPGRGDVIPGGGGTRKVRVADPRRGKGKCGGLRIVYLHAPEQETIFLFAVYDKNEAADLTPSQKRDIVASAEENKREYSESKRKVR